MLDAHVAANISRLEFEFLSCEASHASADSGLGRKAKILSSSHVNGRIGMIVRGGFTESDQIAASN